MSRKILGYPLRPDWRDTKPQVLELPIGGARALSVKVVEGGSFTLFVEHDPDTEPKRMRKVLILKSGHDVDEYGGGYSYIGTMVSGPWTWHVYLANEKKAQKKAANSEG